MTDSGGWAPALLYCPHVVDAIKYPPDKRPNPDEQCSIEGCTVNTETWVCLYCFKVFCGRYANGHMIHHKNDIHCIALGYADLSFWCYKCNNYLHHLNMEKVFNIYSKFHLTKFGEETESHLKECDITSTTQFENLSFVDEKTDDSGKKQNISFHRTGIVYDSRYELHVGPDGHPERPDRTRIIVSKLRFMGILDRCVRIPAREATDEELQSTHSKGHIKKISKTKDQDWSSKSQIHIDSDTFCSERSSEIARLAAGGLIDLCVKVLSREIENGMACIRPPGHHADEGRAMGFCLFNNIAICANVIRKKFNLSRIAIVDWDVHHGNGTQDIFYKDPDVLYCSIHRFAMGFYPGTGKISDVGERKGRGRNVNVPVQVPRAGDTEFLQAFERVFIPILGEFDPELILVSCGFDAARGDMLGGFDVTPLGYAKMTKMLLGVNPRVVLALEGGYNLDSISNSAVAVFKMLLGDKIEEITDINEEILDGDVSKENSQKKINEKRFKKFNTTLNSVIETQRNYWNCFTATNVQNEIDDLTKNVEKLSMNESKEAKEVFSFISKKKTGAKQSDKPKTRSKNSLGNPAEFYRFEYELSKQQMIWNEQIRNAENAVGSQQQSVNTSKYSKM